MPRLTLLAFALALPVVLHAQLPDSIQRRVDAVFADVARTDGPGCSVGISDGGRRYLRGYGMADLERGIAIGPGSIFHVASVSKQFTAMSVALLAEEGRLSLDDDVRRHVPELPDLGVPITIRQLMHHTSGIRDQWSLLAMAGWRADDLITEENVLWILGRQRGLNFPPGREYLYSNSGYTLLAVITRRVSGQSLRDFAASRIFAPLGMRSTHFHDDHAMVVPGRTSAYAGGGGSWRVSVPVFDTYGATSLFTTPDDLLTWMAFLDRVHDEDSAWGRVVRQAETSGLLSDGTPIAYGFGLSLAPWRGLRAVGHSGADAGYRAFVERYPAEGVAIAVACNLASANPAVRAHDAVTAVLGNRLPMEMVEMRAPDHVPTAPTRAAWAGVYRDTVSQTVLRVEERGDSLLLNGARLRFGTDSTASTANMPGYFLRRGDGSALVTQSGGLRERVLLRQPPPFTTFEAYAGRYRGEELDIEYQLAVEDGVLQLRRGRRGSATLTAVSRDAFQAGGDLLLFARDRRGRVTGFTLNSGRVRGVRFVRAR